MKDLVSTETPGLIVLARLTALRYNPFAVDGFNLMIALTNSVVLPINFSGVKEIRPIDAWMIPALSTLKAILPPLTSLTAPATSFVTVPVFGLGIKLRGPSILPNLPILGIT